MEIVNLNSGESLAKGWGNYCSLQVWGDLVYWRYQDEFEEWDLHKAGTNIGENCSLNRAYVKLAQEKNFKECDGVLEDFEKRTKAV